MARNLLPNNAVPHHAVATYRLQVHAGFDLDRAAALADYLAALGVSHAYTSPLLQAVPGSTHGYDTVDPTRIDEERGGEAALERFHTALARHRLGHVLDIVPNHMATATPDNPWWWDVLRRGRASRYARFFDIEWEPDTPELQGRVLVPILGRRQEEAVHAGEITLGRLLAPGSETHPPPREDARSTRSARSGQASSSPTRTGGGEASMGVGAGLAPARGPDTSTPPPAAEPVVRYFEHVFPLSLSRLDPADREAVEAGEDLPPERLLAVLDRQPYRLSHWRRARGELNYRRFFDISDLAGVRQEDPEVFAATHERVLPLVADGKVDGLRIDHPDGLRDPVEYLERLAEASGGAWTVVEKILEPGEPLREDWPVAGTTGYDFGATAGGLFVDPEGEAPLTALWREVSGDDRDWEAVVRAKKLRAMERVLPAELGRLDTLVADYLHHRLDPEQQTAPAQALRQAQGDKQGEAQGAKEGEAQADKEGEVNRHPDPPSSCRPDEWRDLGGGEPRSPSQALRQLPSASLRTAQGDKEGEAHGAKEGGNCRPDEWRDLCPEPPGDPLTPLLARAPEALRELLAAFPVYRTYVRPGRPVDPADEEAVAHAVTRARTERPDLDPKLFDLLADALLVRRPDDPSAAELAARFQQVSGPVMAKGVEDTAFYAWVRFVAANEVGDSPGRFGVAPADFHAFCRDRAARWPETQNAVSTHDSKRSADVRAGLWLLSEIPKRWADAVRRWQKRNRRYKTGGLPDGAAEYLLYQTLVGAWPLHPDQEGDRARAYMEKAAREAKVHTTWTAPNADYERALQGFVDGVLGDEDFQADLDAFAKPLEAPRRVNAVALTLLHLAAPGVPDLYQGDELWNLSLVDPDNRRPVDFDLRRRLLSELDGAEVEEVLRRSDEGLPKLWTLRHALDLRRRRPQVFGPGSGYEPIIAEGEQAEHAVAFVRTAPAGSEGAALTLVPRLVLGLAGEWGRTALPVPPGSWRNVLTGDAVEGGREIPVADLLARFPVALLERETL